MVCQNVISHFSFVRSRVSPLDDEPAAEEEAGAEDEDEAGAEDEAGVEDEAGADEAGAVELETAAEVVGPQLVTNVRPANARMRFDRCFL